jgi:membrane-associated phospholipid phosphatase
MSDERRDAAEPPKALNRLAAMLLVGYAVAMVVVMTVNRVRVTPDVLFVFLAIAALLVGRGLRFIRDWFPFIVILLAWEAMRGLADDVGATVHSDSVIAVERALTFGLVPPVALQETLYRADSINPLDVVCSITYLGHFAFPLLVAFFLWLRQRPNYYRFAAVLMVMSFAAFAIFVVLPVAPPRYAGDYGEALRVHDILAETMRKLDIQAFASWAYANMSGNEVAAFPSLHSAYPALALLFVWRQRSLAIGVGLYAILVWFSVMYLGHHYLVDVLGGIALALLTYAAVVWSGLIDRVMGSVAPELKVVPKGSEHDTRV